MGSLNWDRSSQNRGVKSPAEKKAATIDKRQEGQKEEFLVCISQGFVITAACKKVGISRATYYRWQEEDEGFAKAVEKMGHQGHDVIYDRAMANVVRKISDGDLQASRYFIEWHRKKYAKSDECDKPHVTLVMDM